jgi:hypothetical protein
MWRAALGFLACSSPSAVPLHSIAPPDPPPKRFAGLTIQLDDEPEQLFGDRGACLIGGNAKWLIDVPSRDDECTSGSRPGDDWFALALPRCGTQRCAVPQPGASHDVEIRIIKPFGDDDITIPIQVRVTVKRHEPPLVFLGFAALPIVEAGFSRVTIRGELAVRFDDEDLVDARSWRRQERTNAR